MIRVSLFKLQCFICAVLVALFLQPIVAEEISADFFVATNGSDDWSGTLAEPNAEQTDGELSAYKGSLEQAL